MEPMSTDYCYYCLFRFRPLVHIGSTGNGTQWNPLVYWYRHSLHDTDPDSRFTKVYKTVLIHVRDVRVEKVVPFESGNLLAVCICIACIQEADEEHWCWTIARSQYISTTIIIMINSSVEGDLRKEKKKHNTEREDEENTIKLRRRLMVWFFISASTSYFFFLSKNRVCTFTQQTDDKTLFQTIFISLKCSSVCLCCHVFVPRDSQINIQ